MTIATPQLMEIQRIGNIARMLLGIEGEINQLDILFNGDSNWAALITQEAVDAIPQLAAAGLTAQNIIDALYVLKQVRIQTMTVNLPALVALSHQ